MFLPIQLRDQNESMTYGIFLLKTHSNVATVCLFLLHPLIFFYSESRMQALKVVSVILLLVCFVSLKESTHEARTNVFNFTLKALFVYEIIKF